MVIALKVRQLDFNLPDFLMKEKSEV